MDFYRIKERSTKNGVIEIYPDFKVGRSKDLMVRGKSFYAIWDDENGLWSTDEYDVQRLVDNDLFRHYEELRKKTNGHIAVMYMRDFSSRSWTTFQNFVTNLSDNSHQLDNKLIFTNTEVKKTDYISRRLDYPLEEGSIASYDEIMSTLYSESERKKLEWAVGAIIAGDAKYIQKFIVLYGAQGSGKSTFLNIVQKLFHGYYIAFEAKALTSNNNSFATEVFKTNPLVAIQHDGDLSRIEDNSRMNSIVSHEEMIMNEKYKPSYTSRINSFLFMGTNKPVKITDAKSGIIRRLIDVSPSGNLLPIRRYDALYSQIDFELGAIAHHCLQVYRDLGRSYFNDYRPVDMIMQTDVFYNFVEEQAFVFGDMPGITLSQAYDMYKSYCEMALVEYKLTRHKFREELKNYFTTFHAITRVDNKQVRSYYEGFITERFDYTNFDEGTERVKPLSLVLEDTESLMDQVMADYPAQYANANGTPKRAWDKVKTTVKDLDTSKLHYVNGPLNHIVIDFDLKDEEGNKSAELNLEAASKFPHTYAEFSQGGAGVHLHYWYDGDADRLRSIYETDIEVKVYRGDASIRRRLSKCNNIPMATLNSGLPLKGVKVINQNVVQSEKSIRDLIERNLKKEIHPGTKPSIDFIAKILEDAYDSGLVYDVSNLKRRVLAFANNSTNHAHYCLSQVIKMNFQSEVEAEPVIEEDDKPLVFFDLEVFPNVLLIGWKFPGADKEVNVMINPTPEEMRIFLQNRLVGFNNRRYDNHVLYARYIGWSNEQIYNLSQSIINNKGNPYFREAYSLAHADVYEFASEKMSLKKWMVKLNIFHKELDLPWDEPLKDEDIEKVVFYMKNDVIATEEVFNDRISDYTARQILSELSGLPIYNTTRQHATKLFFGDEKNPQQHFVYTDLSTLFPGYKYEMGVSTYREKIASEGGYVYAVPGMWYNVGLHDVESLHPRSAVLLNIFGKYTYVLNELLEARLGVKHHEFDGVADLYNGKLKKYLTDPERADALSFALKIVINSIYGYTAAKFENAFRDLRNKDNIVAKRGALFMIDLQYAVQEQGYQVVHIKTDSIKIANSDQYITDFVKDFGERYGYTFQHEATYSQMCLVNDAVYIAKTSWAMKAKDIGKWTATGAQFAHPYVFKSLFSKEKILFEDMCETKSVKSTIYLDHNEDLPEGEHDYKFVGKTGMFTPIVAGKGAGQLIRQTDGKDYAVTGSKGYRWMESSDVKALNMESSIDLDYYRDLVEAARENIGQYGDVDAFINYSWLDECEVKHDGQEPKGDTNEKITIYPKLNSRGSTNSVRELRG